MEIKGKNSCKVLKTVLRTCKHLVLNSLINSIRISIAELQCWNLGFYFFLSLPVAGAVICIIKLFRDVLRSTSHTHTNQNQHRNQLHRC